MVFSGSITDASVSRVIGTRLKFPRDDKGSCVRVRRLLARSVEGRPSQSSMSANDLLMQLRHPFPPSPQVSRFSSFCIYPVVHVFLALVQVLWRKCCGTPFGGTETSVFSASFWLHASTRIYAGDYSRITCAGSGSSTARGTACV